MALFQNYKREQPKAAPEDNLTPEDKTALRDALSRLDAVIKRAAAAPEFMNEKGGAILNRCVRVHAKASEALDADD
jgi:hypothetical protein